LRSIREWARTHGDDFDVKEYRAPNFTVYQRELADKEEDVLVFMLWWSWNGTEWVRGGGHWVVGNSVNQTRNPAPRNDTHWVDVMDPWTGTVVQKRMRDDGWIEWTAGSLWGEVWNIVSVSPKTDTRTTIPLGTDSSPSGGWGTGWDTSMVDNGYYFIEALASYGSGVTGEAVTLVKVENQGEEPNNPCEPADHVLISEVMYDSPSDPAAEWVELYNPTGSPVDLTGWRLYDNVAAYYFPDNTIIGPGEYLTLADNFQDAFFDIYGCHPDLGDFGRPLSNSGDYLELRDNGMILVDSVAWKNGSSQSHPGWDLMATENHSILRDPSYCDTDLPDDWLNNQTPDPSCNEGEPQDGFCLEIVDLRILDEDFNPASEIEPGTLYSIEVTTENTCDEDISLLQIAEVTDSSNITIGLGTIKYEIDALQTSVTTLGFLLPVSTSEGETLNVTVLNWNHWPSEGPDPWKPLSDPGFIQFLAQSGGMT
jgi:hypothetical protein